MVDMEDLQPGQQFGYLTVVEKIDRYYPNGRESQKYKCRCVCGKECIVLRSSLVTGGRKSCGCRNAKASAPGLSDSQTPLYYKWQTIKHSKVPHDPEWDTFSNFKVWSGLHHYTPEKKLMMLDPNNKYWGPDTCDWVDKATYDEEHAKRYIEARRRTSRAYHDRALKKKATRGPIKRTKNTLVMYKGQIAYTVKEWSQLLCLSTIVLYKRLTNTYSGTMEEAFQRPFKTRDILAELEEHLRYIQENHPEQLLTAPLPIEEDTSGSVSEEEPVAQQSAIQTEAEASKDYDEEVETPEYDEEDVAGNDEYYDEYYDEDSEELTDEDDESIGEDVIYDGEEGLEPEDPAPYSQPSHPNQYPSYYY